MNILAIDDERIMLDELTREVKKVFPNENIRSERIPREALEWITELKENGETLDYAFLDISMRGMTGLKLAEHIKEIYPNVVIMFCTAYSEYALDAIRMYAKGYILKPVRAEEIIKTLDEMVYGWREAKSENQKEIKAQTFGHFEIFVDGKPVVFEREKSKELLAYLIDRHGSSVTTKQIASVLWEDKSYDMKMKNYVSTVLNSLRNSLKAVGVEDLLIKSRNHLSIDVQKIKCDAYDYENGDKKAINSFKGEYMINYSWAEYTTGNYVSQQLDKNK